MRAHQIKILSLLLILLLPLRALAHKQSDSFLKIDLGEGRSSTWEVALRDLEYAVGLDQNDDLQITWGEVKQKTDAIQKYASERLGISIGEESVTPQYNRLSIANHSDGAYAVLHFTLPEFPIGKMARIRYDLMFDLDLQHRGLLRVSQGGEVTTHVFSPELREVAFEVGRAGSGPFWLFFREGVWHIWKGFDHVLFLIALLIPAVLVRRESGWEAAGSLQSVFLRVIKIVTAFTIAHSITLTLASLEILTIPAGIIEPIIAASVVLAAANNIFRWFEEKLWTFAFGFGLVHGFGFAFVLQDLGISKAELFTSLIGFNLGVEAGQLALVGLIIPVTYLARCTTGYRKVFLQYGSAGIGVIALTWMFERVLDFKLLPF